MANQSAPSPWKIVLVVLTMLLLGQASSCPRECDSADNCKRTPCRCTDASRPNSEVECGLTFRCETAPGVCEDDYNISCDELCQTYAARSLCDRRRCLDDGECLRQVTCPVIDANNQPVPGQSFNCDLIFTCDTPNSVCAPLDNGVDANSTDDIICAECRAQAIGQTQEQVQQ